MGVIDMRAPFDDPDIRHKIWLEAIGLPPGYDRVTMLRSVGPYADVKLMAAGRQLEPMVYHPESGWILLSQVGLADQDPPTETEH